MNYWNVVYTVPTAEQPDPFVVCLRHAFDLFEIGGPWADQVYDDYDPEYVASRIRELGGTVSSRCCEECADLENDYANA